MKLRKALGPSGIAVRMIQASDDKGTSKICGLAAAINCNGKVLSYWEQSFIVCLYKGKEDAWKSGESRVLKLTKQVMKVLDRIMVCLRQLVNRRFPVWLCPRQRHNRCNFCRKAAAREVSIQQETLHGFCRPGEGI